MLGVPLQLAARQLRPDRGARAAAAGYQKRESRCAGRSVAVSQIGGVSILKPKEMGGITGYDMNTGDKKWWIPNGNAWREQTTTSPLFSGVTLPRVPAFGGQPQVITTKTLVIYGTGRSGQSGGRAVVAAVEAARAARAPVARHQLLLTRCLSRQASTPSTRQRDGKWPRSGSLR